MLLLSLLLLLLLLSLLLLKLFLLLLLTGYENVLQVQQFSASMGANENNRNSLTKVNGEFQQQQQQQQIMSTRTGMTGMHINRKLNTLLAQYIHNNTYRYI